MMTQEEALQKTPLYDHHVKLGGHMVGFAGYELPLYYSSILQEHAWVRSSCGLFDVSHLGEIRVTGKSAFSFLERMIPSDLGVIRDGGILYTVFLNEEGGVLDDLMVYRQGPDSFYLVINAARIERDTRHLLSYAPREAEVVNESDRTAGVALQGPKAVRVGEALIDSSIATLRPRTFKSVPGWRKGVWISRTGYTGEDGFEIFSDSETIGEIWNTLLEKGRALGLRPAGLGARNTLRLEAGNILYGVDVDETRTPFEARLSRLVSESKKDFVGQRRLEERKKAGFTSRLIGFKIQGEGVPREGYPILKNERKVGKVTSGTWSPTLKTGIGLGYVELGLMEPGISLQIEIHGRKVDAEVSSLPFVPIHH